MRLTEPRKYLLRNALFTAYMQGWDGTLADIKKRPRIDGWSGTTMQACRVFREQGLTRNLAKGGPLYWHYLTKEGVALAEKLTVEQDGQSARELAEQQIAGEEKERRDIEGEMRSIAYFFRGLRLREFSGLKPEAISTMIKHRRLDDGFSLQLDRRALLELGRQIEKLR